MKQNINGQSVATRIKMLRSQHKGSFLLVEGDTDSRFYINLIDQTTCRIQIGYGRNNVIKAIEILEQMKVPGIVAIIDADFAVLGPFTSTNNSLYLTDTHDLETMLVKSPALEKVLSNLIPIGDMHLVSHIAETVRKKAVEAGVILGYLRWISLEDKIHFGFKKLDLSPLINNDLDLKLEQLITEICDFSSDIDANSLFVRVAKLRSGQHDVWQICCGHDVVKVLSIIIPLVINEQCPSLRSAREFRQITFDNIDKDLRLSYEFEFFRNTFLYASLRDWEMSNVPYRVLPVES
jgi:hypothetical protein